MRELSADEFQMRMNLQGVDEAPVETPLASNNNSFRRSLVSPTLSYFIRDRTECMCILGNQHRNITAVFELHSTSADTIPNNVAADVLKVTALQDVVLEKIWDSVRNANILKSL